MEEAQAISLVVDFIRSRGLDYPTEDLEADRSETGWSVYAPIDVDESDPMSFLEMPVGRSVFMIGDSGRIAEVSSSVPPQVAEAEFTAQELAAQSNGDGSGRCNRGRGPAGDGHVIDRTEGNWRRNSRNIRL
jgi:hypothetical protein